MFLIKLWVYKSNDISQETNVLTNEITNTSMENVELSFSIIDNKDAIFSVYPDFPFDPNVETIETIQSKIEKSLVIISCFDKAFYFTSLYTIGKCYYETEDVVVYPRVVSLFNKPVYSFSFKIKIKNGQISPVSSISICRKKDDTKKITFTLDYLIEKGAFAVSE